MSRSWIKPSWFAVLLVSVGIIAFSCLGVWQLQRSTEKELLLAAYDSADTQSTMTLAQARSKGPGGAYPHVELNGRFDPAHTYLLDDQIRGGRQGVLAFALFVPSDGSTPLLVNRGFVARTDTAALPELPALPADAQTIAGLYAPAPGSGLRLGGNALPQQARWPKLTIYIDLAEIGEDLGQRIDSAVILLDADPASGFVREWTPQIIPPQRHLGYAFQWFCFALAAIVIFIVLHWRQSKN